MLIIGLEVRQLVTRRKRKFKRPDKILSYARDLLTLGLLYTELFDPVKEGDGYPGRSRVQHNCLFSSEEVERPPLLVSWEEGSASEGELEGFSLQPS